MSMYARAVTDSRGKKSMLQEEFGDLIVSNRYDAGTRDRWKTSYIRMEKGRLGDLLSSNNNNTELLAQYIMREIPGARADEECFSGREKTVVSIKFRGVVYRLSGGKIHASR